MHTMRTYLFLLIAAAMLPLHANAKDIAACMQDTYGKTQSFQAEFTQQLHHKESGTTEERFGNLAIKKPQLVRWETTKPSSELFVVGKNVIWSYFADEEVAYKYPLNLVNETKTILRFIAGQGKLEDDFYIEPGADENGLTKIELFPKEPTTELVEAAVWVSPSTCLIQKAETTDFYGNKNEVVFNKVTTGAELNDTLFEFTPPKGIDIEDRTESAPAGKKLAK